MDQLVLYVLALAAAIGWAVWTRQKLLACGFAAFLVFSIPALASTMRHGDFWMGESLAAGVGLIIGTAFIVTGILRDR